MKKKIFLLALFLCVLVIFACALVPASAQVETPTEVSTENKALSARFTNMLNRNFSYNSDFDSVDILTDNSIYALLDKRDGENPEYISDAVVKGFVNDMYGTKVTEISDNPGMHKDGFVYITPRGFTTYKHTIKAVTENEDGSYTVSSAVTVNPHDDDEFYTTAETLLIKNPDSAFGYNIVYSNLAGIVNGI